MESLRAQPPLNGLNELNVLNQYLLYYYPKTNTNMFVIACRLNIPEVEGSLIRKFLAPRSPRSQSWEFIFSLPLRPLRALRETFRVSVAAVRRQGEPLFPSAVWEKACTTMLESLRGSRKFSGDLEYSNTGN
jgi:hypothetical protein